jgi:hypothetical protein
MFPTRSRHRNRVKKEDSAGREENNGDAVFHGKVLLVEGIGGSAVPSCTNPRGLPSARAASAVSWSPKGENDMTPTSIRKVHGLMALPILIFVASSAGAQDVNVQGKGVIRVSSVAELYAAVNDPDNAGVRIVVAPGTYFLDPTQPNGGRLELQQDMEIIGQHGDATGVVIDATNLTADSYRLDFGFTAPVRMGRGSNALEWMTVQNASLPAAAGVETDLLGVGATSVRVAHIIAQRNPIGIDFRNPSTFNGRVLHGVAEDNVLRHNTAQNGIGIRVVNTNGVTRATAWITLRRNRSYGNLRGMFASNLNSSGNVILIESRADQFTNNIAGCELQAGTSTGGVANSNLLVFHAEHDVISDNDGSSEHPGPSGLGVFGADSTVAPELTSGNLLQIVLTGVRFSGNHPDSDVLAWGAHGNDGVFPGTDNHVELLLKGISRRAALRIVDSDPPDPNGTNTVVMREAF